MGNVGKNPADVLPRRALAALDSQAYRVVEKHYPKMDQSARSYSASVPAVLDLQQPQPFPRHVGTDADSRFVRSKAQSQKCESTF